MVMAVEIVSPRVWRIRLRRIDRDAATHVIPCAGGGRSLEPQVRTDGSAAYRAWENCCYTHQRTVMLAQAYLPVTCMAECTGSPHWYSAGAGNTSWSVQPDHLDAYSDEFRVRFNWRTSSSTWMCLPFAAASGSYAASDVLGMP